MKIAIIGGGITGLTTALALNKLGFSCQVYERAPQLNEVGAGIWMQPNALKVLDWVGVGDKVRKAGLQIDGVEFAKPDLTAVRKLNRHNITVNKQNRITSIHRARLQKVLFEAVPKGMAHLGKEYIGHSQEKDKVTIHFHGDTVTADLLLGADGIHSKIRQQLFPNSDTRYSGQTCWRGISNMNLPFDQKRNGLEAWGPKIRFGFAAISDTEVYWFAVAKAPEGQKDLKSTVKLKLQLLFKNFHPLVHELLEQTPQEKIIRNDISDLRRLKTWHQERVCLIGDAAHATTPNMGQGGGQGVEDAYYFSNILSRSNDYREAYSKFEKERRKKVDYIVNTSWQFGKMAHSPIGQQLFKMMLKWTPEKILEQQVQRMYKINEYM